MALMSLADAYGLKDQTGLKDTGPSATSAPAKSGSRLAGALTDKDNETLKDLGIASGATKLAGLGAGLTGQADLAKALSAAGYLADIPVVLLSEEPDVKKGLRLARSATGLGKLGVDAFDLAGGAEGALSTGLGFAGPALTVGEGIFDIASGNEAPGAVEVGGGLLSAGLLTNPVTAPFAFLPLLGSSLSGGLMGIGAKQDIAQTKKTVKNLKNMSSFVKDQQTDLDQVLADAKAGDAAALDDLETRLDDYRGKFVTRRDVFDLPETGRQQVEDSKLLKTYSDQALDIYDTLQQAGRDPSEGSIQKGSLFVWEMLALGRKVPDYYVADDRAATDTFIASYKGEDLSSLTTDGLLDFPAQERLLPADLTVQEVKDRLPEYYRLLDLEQAALKTSYGTASGEGGDGGGGGDGGE